MSNFYPPQFNGEIVTVSNLYVWYIFLVDGTDVECPAQAARGAEVIIHGSLYEQRGCFCVAQEQQLVVDPYLCRVHI